MRRFFLLLAACLWVVPILVRADDEPQFYPPSWADSSGKDGKGGVSIVVSGPTRQFLLEPDVCKEKVDGKTLGDHPDWVVYDGEESGKALAFRFKWITKPNDKFWGQKWAGGGIAFNTSWNPVNFSGAKYLVFYAKTNVPGVDFNVGLTGSTDADITGFVKMNDYAEGHQVGTNWTRVVIPLGAIPSLSKVDLTQVKTLRFDLTGDYPENQSVYIHMDKLYFTDVKLVTPVENIGWIKVPGGAEVVWDKTDDSGITRYLVTVDGKVAGRLDGGDKRKVKLPASVLSGAGPHVVGVASSDGKQDSSYQSVTISLASKAAETAVVSLSAKAAHEISPDIYGFNYMSSEDLKKEGGVLNRWGGNDTTSYNWKDDADNHGLDWFFLNTGGPLGIAEKDKRYYKFVQDTLAGGADPIITIPIDGWMAKVPPSDQKFGSFPLSLFPTEAPGGEPGLGKGETPDGKKLWGNDPNYNYLPSTPEIQAEWVKALVKDFGPSTKGGVKIYQMDNEPGLWNENHRDVRPKGVGYDELADLNATYAAAVKGVDPKAKVIGMVAWGVMELAGSAWDYMPGGVTGYKKEGDGPKWTDRKAHGDVPQVAWFLKELSKKSDKAGKRLIDYVDDHGFPEVWGKNAKGEKVNVLGDFPYDPVVTPQQFEAMRIFWDPTFESPDSWCANQWNKPYLWDPFVGLIPKMKKIIAENYPGTKLAMTEYYPASKSYYHGGLLEALNLGIFMREGMDLACDWDGAHAGNYVFLAHQLYSNYDGQGSKVLGNYVDCTNDSKDLYSFAARNGAKTFVILINRNHDSDIDTTVNLPAAASAYRTYSLTETAGKRLYDSGEQTATGSKIKLDVPAFSAILVVAQTGHKAE